MADHPATTVSDLDANTPDLSEDAIGLVAAQLDLVHRDIRSRLGHEVYVNVSATWQGAGGNLVTLSVASTDPDLDDEDDA